MSSAGRKVLRWRVAQSLPDLGRPRQVVRSAVLSAPRMSALEVEQRGNALRIRVRVKPRASKSRILSPREGALEVSVAAPPVDGEANLELIRTLAAALGCAKSAIEIVSGPGSRSKLVAIVGFSEAQLVAKLNLASGD